MGAICFARHGTVLLGGLLKSRGGGAGIHRGLKIPRLIACGFDSRPRQRRTNMKSLFNRYEAYNEVGRLVSNELQAAIDPVMEKWAKKGYKVNDIESIAFSNVSISGAIIRMEKSMGLVKQEREESSSQTLTSSKGELAMGEEKSSPEDPQKEVQRIYENEILPELDKQRDEDFVNVSLSQEEFKAVCDFFAMFAYS